MRILFWGTPDYAVPTLQAVLEAGHEVVGVVSQPDRRRGRGGATSPSPVKHRAIDWGLPVWTPERLRRDLELQAHLATLEAEVSVVVAYGQILPKAVLDQPPLGCWNGHGSLLPRWRGAAPIQWALLEGDRFTGVGIMAMEEGLDTGPVLLQERLEIDPLENAQSLAGRLATLTAHLMVQALPRISAAGGGPQAERWARLGLRSQPEEGITYARLLTRDDYVLQWARPAMELHRRVMGLYPGAHTLWRGRRLKVLATEPLLAGTAGGWAAPGGLGPWARRLAQGRPPAPGEVMAVEEGRGLVVACGEGALLVREVQLEGKTPCQGAALLQQLGARPGDGFGGTDE
ncbi:MAG: methionyl-tRNA formyltransferase [Cyanobacteriota bacterium]|jgi:methionyl-tRNA formyltransferase